MLGLAGLPPVAQALAVVVAVVVEAAVLYLGYRYVEERLGSRVIEAIEGI